MLKKRKELEKTVRELNLRIKSLENLTAQLERQNELKEIELGLKDPKKDLTGLPSIDQPWLKFFPKEAQTDKINEYTLYEQLKNANQENLEEIALSYNGEKITFRKLFHQIDLVAGSFLSIGINKGDIVTICLPNIPEFVYTFYALNKIGAIASLIEPRTNAERIKGFVNNAQSKVMVMLDLCKENIEKIIDSSTLELIISVSAANSLENKAKKSLYTMAHKEIKTGGIYLNWQDFTKVKRLSNISAEKYQPNQTAAIVYTSGTTGVPKGAELTNETYNGQNMQLKYSGIVPKNGDIFLGNVPFFSAYGSSSGMHNALTNGVEIALLPSYKPEDFPSILLKYRPNHVMGVPRFYELLLQDKLAQNNDFSFLDNIISGGDKMAPTNEKKVNKFLKNHGAPNLKKGLGMSEFGGGFVTTVSNTSNKIGSVGVPHIGNNVKILDVNTKEELSYGKAHQVGELYVTGPTMMKRYFNNPIETEKFFVTDEQGIKWAKTGDLVYMDEDGVIFFVDRIKNVIMRPDGHTTPLLPIENAISKHPNVLNCAAVGVNVEKGKTGALPMVFIVLKEDQKIDLIQEEIEELCELNIPVRERPKWYRYVKEIPYNLAGKVDMLKLKEMGITEDLNQKVMKY